MKIGRRIQSGPTLSGFPARLVDGLIQYDIRGFHPRLRESRMRVNGVGELGSRQFSPHCSSGLTDQLRGVRSHDLSPQQLISPRIGDPLDEAHLITKRKGLSQCCEWKFSCFDLPSLALSLLFAQAHGRDFRSSKDAQRYVMFVFSASPSAGALRGNESL